MGKAFCYFTDEFISENKIRTSQSLCVEYIGDKAGHVKITQQAALIIKEISFPREIIAGICRHRTMKNQEPILIDIEFLSKGYKLLNPPESFEQKREGFLELFFNAYGKDNSGIKLNSTTDAPMAYSNSNQFIQIIRSLKDDGFINYSNDRKISSEHIEFSNVIITSKGRTLFEKSKLLETENFVGANNINIQTMSNSVIQQGNINSNQTVKINELDLNEIKRYIQYIENNLPQLQLNSEIIAEVLSEISTLKSQCESPKPKSIILQEGLKSLRNIFENVASSEIGKFLIEKTDAFLQMLM